MALKKKILIVGAIAAAALILYVGYQLYAGTQPETASPVISSTDADQDQILNELYSKGYISNTFSYRLLQVLSALYRPIRAGGYYLAKGMSTWQMYQELASPSIKYIRIVQGLRKEQIADIFAKNLSWSEEEKKEFLATEKGEPNDEGRFYPDTYLLPKETTPKEARQAMRAKFIENIENVYNASTTPGIINLDTALKIASLIEREAGGKNDMKLISGIIWNRLFLAMPLQIDASLQYAKGTSENGWWPRVRPEDKKIDSPYNTYKNDGLPPAPIANPSKASINAAFHPAHTSCLFYIHDLDGVFHCSSTYSGHLQNIRLYYAVAVAN